MPHDALATRQRLLAAIAVWSAERTKHGASICIQGLYRVSEVSGYRVIQGPEYSLVLHILIRNAAHQEFRHDRRARCHMGRPTPEQKLIVGVHFRPVHVKDLLGVDAAILTIHNQLFCRNTGFGNSLGSIFCVHVY